MVDRNIYHHVTKIQQLDWCLATHATRNMSTLLAEEAACAGAGAGAAGSSSRLASTELIANMCMSQSVVPATVAMRGCCSGREDARLGNTQIIHNIPQVYHVPSPPKYVHVPVPGPKIHKVAGGRATASAVEFV